MNNNSLVEKKEYSFFDKIKNFFRKIFGKGSDEVVIEKTSIITDTVEVEESFKENLSNSTNTEKLQKDSKVIEIIDIIEKNPKTLRKLSMDKLEIIDNYYVEKISEVDNKISNLKRKLA